MFTEIHENKSVRPFGDRLREARESLDMTLDELSKTLKLKIQILESLEKSDIENLPPSIYVQGYIKAYTKALGISSEEIHADYLKISGMKRGVELQPMSPLPAETNSQSPIVKTFSILFGVLGLSAFTFGIYSYYSDKVEMNNHTTAEIEIDGATSVSRQTQKIVIKQKAKIIEENELLPGEISDEVSIKDGYSANEESPLVKEAKNNETIKNEIVTDVITQNQDTLMIRATSESWAEVHDANKTRLYFDLLKPDDFLILNGKAPFDIFLGNALNVNIAVNDFDVDMSRHIRTNNTAHFKVSEKSSQIVFH